jgi:stage IV sporulation protein FB
MLGPVAPTEFDLRFDVLGIPVRVSPWFWLGAALLGSSALRADYRFFVICIMVVFVSILVHELGHALTARAFGYAPHILLYQFGGLAMYAPHRDYSVVRSILITAAGPAAGLLLGGLTYAVLIGLRIRDVPLNDYASYFILQMLWVNLAWSLVNLLPVLPLDGGQISRDLLTHFSPRKGLTIALQLSLVTGVLVAAWALSIRSTYVAILFGLLAFQSFSELQNRRSW